jgi:hypothetical protein
MSNMQSVALTLKIKWHYSMGSSFYMKMLQVRGSFYDFFPVAVERSTAAFLICS